MSEYITYNHNCYFPQTVCFNHSYSLPIDIENAIKHFAVIGLTETSYSTIYDQEKDAVCINVTAKANGAQHATGIRSNLWNYSTDGRGNTAFYGQAVGTPYGRWSAALHGETKHIADLQSGITVGCSIEVCTFSDKGTPYGLLINNTTGATGEKVAGYSEKENPNTHAINVIGRKFNKGISLNAKCDTYFEIQGQQILSERINGFPDVIQLTTEEYNRLLAALRKHGILGL